MHVKASGRIEKGHCRNTSFISILVIITFLTAGAAIAENAKGSWDQWLDSAYQLTWHDRPEIANWIAENEGSVFDKPLTGFVKEWETRRHSVPRDGALQVLPDNAIRQLAIGQMLVYLRTSDIEYLKSAVATISAENLKAKLELPEIAFWYYYIRAHYSMEKGEVDRFVKDVYHIWLDVILKLEAEQYEIDDAFSGGSLHGFSSSLPYLYRNLANLILQRAIVDRKMDGIDGLGVIVWNLSLRMPAKGYGKWVELITKRINGPESDNYHLSYAVQLMEAAKKQVMAENLFDAGKEPLKIEKSLVECLESYEKLYGVAKTLQGQATAITKQLQFTSFVLLRLYQDGPHRAVLAAIPALKRRKGRAWHESKAAVVRAIKIYANLTQSSDHARNLIKNGIFSQQSYIATAHELWRAIMNLSLDTALYYERQIDPKNANNLKLNIPLLESAIIRYLNFFEGNVNQGYRETVPDNAYYAAAEAADLLSEMHFLSAPWEKGMKKYDLALVRRIQALEIFPFDVKHYYTTAQRLSDLGRLGTYKNYFFPLADRIRNSHVLKSATVQKGSFLGEDLAHLQAAVPEIIKRAPSSILLEYGLQKAPQELVKRLALIESEAGADSKNSPFDAQTRKQIANMAHQLTLQFSAKKEYAKEDILSILEDIDPLVRLIELKHQDVTTANDSDQLLPFGQNLFSRDIKQLALELKRIKAECILLSQLPDIIELRDTLVVQKDHPFHTLLRQFYHENSRRDLGYPELLKRIMPLQ